MTQGKTSLSTELARERTDWAYERTQMAATRTFFALLRTGLAMGAGRAILVNVDGEIDPKRFEETLMILPESSEEETPGTDRDLLNRGPSGRRPLVELS